jgi:hypothetical protein
MGSPVVHFEVGGSDAERSRRFHQDLFGWEITADDSGYGLVRTGSDDGIGGGVMQAPPGRPTWVAATGHRLRAVEDRWIPRLPEALRRTELDLEELEHAEGVCLRWAAEHRPRVAPPASAPDR